MKDKTCIVISGSSGSGKDTVTAEVLLKLPNLKKFVTTTTRTPRSHEVHGQHYFFVTEDEFLKGIDNGDFYEWDHHYKGYYGCHKERLAEFQEQNPHTLVLLDPNGAKTLKQKIPSAIVIFLLPGSMDELESRLKGPGRGEDEHTLEARLQAAPREIEEAHLMDYHMVTNRNGKLEATVNEVVGILSGHIKN